MLAEWTPARALVAEILDENLGPDCMSDSRMTRTP